MFAFGVGLGIFLLIIGVPVFVAFALGAGTICYYHLNVSWFALSQLMLEPPPSTSFWPYLYISWRQT